MTSLAISRLVASFLRLALAMDYLMRRELRLLSLSVGVFGPVCRCVTPFIRHKTRSLTWARYMRYYCANDNDRRAPPNSSL